MRAALFGSLLVLSAVAGAQPSAPTSPGALAAGYVVDRWNTDAGLPQVSVNAILQTHDGYLWLATLGGIARFDGTSFVGMSTGDEKALLSDRAFALAEDSRGNVWIGTEAGVSRISRGKVTGFGPSNGMPRGEVHTLAADGEGIWFATNAGALGRIDGDSVHVVIEPHTSLGNGVPAIARVGSKLWISAEAGLFVLDGRSAPRFVRPAPTGAASRAALSADPTDGVWMTTDSSVVHVRESGSLETRFPASMPAGEPQAIATGDGRTIWLGRFGGDVWRLRLDSGAAQLIKPAEGGSATKLMIDRERSVWIGNRVTGLARVRPAIFQSFTKNDGLAVDNTASVFVDSKGRLWTAGRCKGVAVRDAAQFHLLPADQSPKCTVTIAEAGGSIWLGGTGIGRWRDGRYESLDTKPNAPNGGIHAIFAAKDGSVWVGGVDGAVVWNGDQFVVRHAKDSAHHEVFESFYQASDGAVWAGTTRGVLRFDATGVRAITREDGLPSADVRAIYQDRDGVMWFATYGGGLARYDGDSIQVFSTADGLFDNSLSSITEDVAGNLWLSGNKGVFRV
ncbi:MAG TPA: two-component regulator propeller domain-containing protein, partial [Gemmatimonadaceae bacterium]